MAIIGSTALTYADWAKRLDDGYKVASIIELLSQTNEILDDMMVVEGNLPTGHKTTVRTGLPQATWRLLNTGVPNAKSTTAQIVDTVGNLETYSVIDKDIADLNGNTPEFRLSSPVPSSKVCPNKSPRSLSTVTNSSTQSASLASLHAIPPSPPPTPKPLPTFSPVAVQPQPTLPSGSRPGASIPTTLPSPKANSLAYNS